MIAVYLGALVVALGVFGVQTLGGHDADAAGHDVSHGDHDAPPWAIVLSVRFWAFALLAFGVTGSLLTFFGLAGPVFAAALASGAGAASGAFATTVIRRMTRKGPSSQVLPGEVVGRVGRVLVPSEKSQRGKVRVEIKGQLVDYVAASSEPLAQGDLVVIEEFADGQVVVSKAPGELK